MSNLQDQIIKASVSMERSKLDIITGTLDAMNSPAGGGKTGTPADIVSGTLDALNSPTYGKGAGSQQAISDSYNFNKSVLSAAYEDKGALFNIKK